MFNFIFFVYFLPSFKNIYDVSKPESHKEIVNKEILETFDDILWATRQLRNSILEKKKNQFSNWKFSDRLWQDKCSIWVENEKLD